MEAENRLDGATERPSNSNRTEDETQMSGAEQNQKQPRKVDVLTLDIRGKVTVKTRSTFTALAGSPLADMFSGRWDAILPKNEKGHS